MQNVSSYDKIEICKLSMSAYNSKDPKNYSNIQIQTCSIHYWRKKASRPILYQYYLLTFYDYSSQHYKYISTREKILSKSIIKFKTRKCRDRDKSLTTYPSYLSEMNVFVKDKKTFSIVDRWLCEDA
jgi:hypothetical protein